MPAQLRTDYEDWLEWRNKRNNPHTFSIKNVYKSFTTFQIILIIVLLFFINNLMNKPGANKDLIMLVGGGVIIFLIWRNATIEKKEIVEERMIKQECLYLMKNKIGLDKEFPAGAEVILSPYCKMRWNISDSTGDTQPFRWEVGFVIKSTNNLRKEYFALFNPYNGICTGIVSSPAGYDATNSPDIKLVEKQMVIIDKEKINPPSN